MGQLDRHSLTENAAGAIPARQENLFLFLRDAFSEIVSGQELTDDLYVQTLCFELQQAALADGGRLIVTMPPRYLKSIAASVVLPAWVLGRTATTKTLVAGYAEALATEHARAFQKLVTSRYYKRVFPGSCVEPVVNNATQFTTSAGGVRRAVTVGGSVTGIGGDLIIVDDIMKASDASSEAHREAARRYFDETLYTRLNDKRSGSIIVVQQRLHQDDLIAHLIEKQTFRHLNFPVIAEASENYRLYNDFHWERQKGDLLAPERESRETLEKIKAEIGEASFRTQYQQDPASAQSTMLDFSKVTVLESDGSDIRRLKVVQTWDTAVKDGPNCDYSVGMTFAWDDERWVLIDVIRRRMKFGDLKVSARRAYEEWRPQLVIVEDSANGSALVADLRAEKRYEFQRRVVKGSKEERFAEAAEWLESGKLVLLRDTDYFNDLRRELCAFPDGRFDDQVDAISLFVKRAKSRRGIGDRGRRNVRR